MVNPQLETNSQALSTDVIYKPMERTVRKTKMQNQKRQQSLHRKRTVILLNDEDIGSDSRLVVDTDAPKTKRKYTKRKPKGKEGDLSNDANIQLVMPCTTSGTTNEIINDQVKQSNQQETTDLTNHTEIKCEAQDKGELPSKKTKKQAADPTIPRVKRKYVKRKLIRKKYTRRKPKENPDDIIAPKTEANCEKSSEISANCEKNSESSIHQTDSINDIDSWIDLEVDDLGFEDFNLLDEEVDDFWNNIEDPNSLFMQLEIE